VRVNGDRDPMRSPSPILAAKTATHRKPPEMAIPHHLEILRQGVDAWNAWRTSAKGPMDIRLNLSEGLTLGNLMKPWRKPDIAPDLSGADLSGADLSKANLSGADFSRANLSEADLSEADLSRAYLRETLLSRVSLVDTNLERADLTGCRVYGISVWNARLDGATQSNLIISREEEPAIQVDNLEVAQFIYLLLNNARIRHVIDTIGKKAVLILGRFTPDRKAILDSIRETLRHLGFLPILFDFEKPSTRDIHETIVTLAGLSRFIIADISDPKSVPQELGSIVPTLPSVPVQPLLQSGYEPWGMYDHIKRYTWVLPLFEYESQKTLLQDLELRVIAPAEEKAKELTRK